MSAQVEITRRDLDAKGLRHAAAKRAEAAAARRMLALALVLEGRLRAEAAERCGMDRQTLRDWVHRYNDRGLAGLYDRKPKGRAPHLDAVQMAELAGIVERGPDLAVDGVVRWRCIYLQPAAIEPSAEFAAGHRVTFVPRLQRGAAVEHGFADLDVWRTDLQRAPIT